MENLFTEILDGIRTLMTVRILSIREAGLAYDQEVCASFWKDVRIEIATFKRKVTDAKNAMTAEEFKRFIHKKPYELFVIMDIRHPEFAIEGWYESPNRPTDPLFFWAYHDLRDLTDWIRATYLRDPDDYIYLPPTFLDLVKNDFVELHEFIGKLRRDGIARNLLTTLMVPFKYFLPSDAVELEDRMWMNLRKLKDAILACREQPKEKMEEALYHVLYAANVNTLESITHCKDYIQQLLAATDTVSGKLTVLAHCEWSIHQVTIVDRQIGFSPTYDPLKNELLKYIADTEKYYAKIETISSLPSEEEALQVKIIESIMIKLSNQHYALLMRVLHEIMSFKVAKRNLSALPNVSYYPIRTNTSDRRPMRKILSIPSSK